MNSIGKIFFLLAISCSLDATVDMIVFSYHRPLQLYALLESTQVFIKNLNRISVVYRADTDTYENGYKIVKDRFSHVRFIQQSREPYKDFKPLLMNLLDNSKPYCLFAVDDIIVKEHVDIELCAILLEKTNAYGFYLRLGKHVDICYSENKFQGIPPLTQVTDTTYSWCFNHGKYDWHYPHTVDMTLYRTQSIIEKIKNLQFCSPNSLEGLWASVNISSVFHKKGLCFNRSKIVNIPINVVQRDWGNYLQGNRNMHSYNSEQLLTFFIQGFKIDTSKLINIENHSAHIEYISTFIPR